MATLEKLLSMIQGLAHQPSKVFKPMWYISIQKTNHVFNHYVGGRLFNKSLPRNKHWSWIHMYDACLKTLHLQWNLDISLSSPFHRWDLWKTSCHAFLAKNSKLSTDPQFEIRKQDLQRTRIVWADLLIPETKYYCILCYMRDISDCFPILLRGNTQLKLAWRWEEHL